MKIARKQDKYSLMKLSIEIMKESIQEDRDDGKVSPSVGAVLVRNNGTIETAYRGELREGDHAEYTLLERKCINENLRGAVVFSTLEPCFDRTPPKIGCCKRLVKARISKVYVGTTDPDPTVNGKGIKYLKEHGVEVEMYPSELQKEIEEFNLDFFKGAYQRRHDSENDNTNDYLSEYEKIVPSMDKSELNIDLVNKFAEKMKVEGKDVDNLLVRMELAENENGLLRPTGLGLLLFGNNPQQIYPNAVVKATLKKDGNVLEVTTIEGPLVKQVEVLFEWAKNHMPSHIDRSGVYRTIKYDYPLEVIRELSVNAIVHRDYEEKGAPVYFEINDEAIIIKSPGLPEPPLKLSQIESFTAPSYSRNPIIMYVLDKFQQVEQRGLGFETVRGLPQKGIPLPEVSYDAPYVVITLPLTGQSALSVYKDLTGDEKKSIDYIRLNGPVSRAEIQQYTNLESKTAIRLLNKLIDKGYVKTIGKSKNTKYVINTIE